MSAGAAVELQAFLRATAAAGRTVVPVPPFTAYLNPANPLRFLNYAIPDGDVEPAPAEVEALRAAFRARERLPRLEWVEEAAPRVAPVLAAAGMVQELRTPLMACGPAELVEASAEVEDLSVAPVGDADLRETSDLQRVAFGMDPHAADAPAASFVRPAGGGAVLARAGGTPVAVAVWTRVIDGCSEVAGVATAERWRRRGLAGVVTAAAARAAFVAGARLCVLSPGDDTAQRVYARAGFRRAATMLHWADPH
ncbi:MAG TPA: GNAT family N-acetyltransferase [Solirubrobacteraceae bacterium]|nr:GNAT family N-acetyltransferase [Solirubrobacteraceae bacterium]